MKFIDLPKPISRQAYADLTQRIINGLDLNLVEAVYQIGSVGHPGISDLDMVVVFKEGHQYRDNPRAKLMPGDSQILTHSVFAGNVDLFQRSFKYSFFHNYELLWGNDLKPKTKISETDLKILKRQIALEYMLKFYLVLGVQKWYGLVKLRTFLLEAKAICYDLDFLGYPVDHPLRRSINKVIEWRAQWFDKAAVPPKREIVALINRIFLEVQEVLQIEFANAPLFFLADSSSKFNLNTRFQNSAQLELNPKGLPVSRLFHLDDKRFFNLMHRLNSFELKLPWTWESCPEILKERFNFAKEFTGYNQEHLPYFSPIVSILKVFK